jgi:quercetin dioxygenase-like cupin family protein
MPFRIAGMTSRDTTISEHTGGVAGVHVVHAGGSPDWVRHNADILFNFVMEGTMVLNGEGKEPYALEPGDAFVIPPGMQTKYSEMSEDLELLEVSLPGVFETT